MGAVEYRRPRASFAMKAGCKNCLLDAESLPQDVQIDDLMI